MLNWLVFMNAIFWVSFFVFLFTSSSFFSLILVSEFVWVILYVIASIVGSIVDDVTSFSITFFILGLASIELCFGLLLLVVIRQLKLSININQNIKLGGVKTFEKLTKCLNYKQRI